MWNPRGTTRQDAARRAGSGVPCELPCPATLDAGAAPLVPRPCFIAPNLVWNFDPPYMFTNPLILIRIGRKLRFHCFLLWVTCNLTSRSTHLKGHGASKFCPLRIHAQGELTWSGPLLEWKIDDAEGPYFLRIVIRYEKRIYWNFWQKIH